MTEAEWLASGDEEAMLDFARERMSERKRRLCALAWARLVITQPSSPWLAKAHRHWLNDPKWEVQLTAAERFADERLGAKELRAARKESGGPHNLFLHACRVTTFSLDNMFRSLTRVMAEFGVPRSSDVRAVLRDVINPFWRGTLPPHWLAWSDALPVKLAQAIYDEAVFARLPILGDVLEDAGCTHDALLAHLRSPGPHVRGCWAVDLILAKS